MVQFDNACGKLRVLITRPARLETGRGEGEKNAPLLGQGSSPKVKGFLAGKLSISLYSFWRQKNLSVLNRLKALSDLCK